MKTIPVALAIAGTIVIALALAIPASAATYTIPGNDFYAIEVGPFGIGGTIIEGSDLSFDWSATGPLSLVVSGPSGTVRTYNSATSGSHTIHITETGDYFMTWTNSGSSAVVLTYDYEVDIFGTAHDVMDTVILGLIVAAIIIVAVIIIVVFVIMGSGKKSQPAQGPAQPAAPLATNATNCPSCGSAIDKSNQWCSKCGAKLR